MRADSYPQHSTLRCTRCVACRRIWTGRARRLHRSTRRPALRTSFLTELCGNTMHCTVQCANNGLSHLLGV